MGFGRVPVDMDARRAWFAGASVSRFLIFRFRLIGPFRANVAIICGFVRAVPHILGLAGQDHRFFVFERLAAVATVNGVSPGVTAAIRRWRGVFASVGLATPGDVDQVSGNLGAHLFFMRIVQNASNEVMFLRVA